MSGNLRQEFNERAMDNLEATNKLLLDMVKNQRSALKSLTKIFIITLSCYTFLVIAMVVGFFIYESQFDVVQGQYETYEYNQEAEGENAEINNGNVYKDNATHNDNRGD